MSAKIESYTYYFNDWGNSPNFLPHKNDSLLYIVQDGY